MKICMILTTGVFPGDRRVEKEAKSLKKAGHSVSILCINKKTLLSKRKAWNRIDVKEIGLPLFPGLFGKLNNVPGFLCVAELFWIFNIFSYSRESGADAIHMHDLPRSKAAAWVAKLLKKKLVIDLHENFPGMMENYANATGSIKRKFISASISPKKWEDYEVDVCSSSDAVITVVEEQKERLVSMGVDCDKISVIENTESKYAYLVRREKQSAGLSLPDGFVCSYIGGFGGRDNYRGLMTVIEAIPEIIKSIPNFIFVLVGKGSIEDSLRKTAKTLGVEKHLSFFGWVDQKVIPDFIEQSDLCIIPYNSTPNTEACSPNKLFQYMLLGKPVLVSSCRSLVRYAEETGGCLVFEKNNPKSLAESVVKLHADGLTEALGAKGYSAVKSTRNWESTQHTLLALYREL